ncbi:MAG: peptidoglycan-binding protein [Eubacterium sp.]|nr:peptidoglycan-binding protein [Eubacterium sp.]
MADTGRLQVQLLSSRSNGPVEGAEVKITVTGQPDQVLEVLQTDSSGQTETIDLTSPPLEFSLEPGEGQPYSEYDIQINARDYESVTIMGVQILSGEKAIQSERLYPLQNPEDSQVLDIGPHTLFGDYPPKIEESETKDILASGQVVLSRVVVPEYVIVHDGAVGDDTADNYYIQYRDYIKNVASCEIYATWPEAALRANILAIMSFTLNRVYTEWYRSKGYDYTITSSTAYDQKWIRGKSTYSSINRIVDEIFDSYLARPDIAQPILTQFCDGRRVMCPAGMSQWGSKDLADEGLTASQILRYYYGDDIYINTAEYISGVPSSFPGYLLTIGSSGAKVRQLQQQLNAIAGAYPRIPRVRVDGIYGQETARAVRAFQEIFDLPVTGDTGFSTWYRISQIYVAVTRIAELT